VSIWAFSPLQRLYRQQTLPFYSQVYFEGLFIYLIDLVDVYLFFSPLKTWWFTFFSVYRVFWQWFMDQYKERSKITSGKTLERLPYLKRFQYQLNFSSGWLVDWLSEETWSSSMRHEEESAEVWKGTGIFYFQSSHLYLYKAL